MTNELVHHPCIRCLECNILLERIPKRNKESISINPNFQYYFRACECNWGDKRIIRVPFVPVKYETVGMHINPYMKAENDQS